MLATRLYLTRCFTAPTMSVGRSASASGRGASTVWAMHSSWPRSMGGRRGALLRRRHRLRTERNPRQGGAATGAELGALRLDSSQSQGCAAFPDRMPDEIFSRALFWNSMIPKGGTIRSWVRHSLDLARTGAISSLHRAGASGCGGGGRLNGFWIARRSHFCGR